MTPPMGDLLALVGRVEQLAGSDRDIDTEILWHVDRRRFTAGYWNAASGMPRELEQMPSKNGGLGWIGAQCNAPAYSASLDAAMTLVPEGCVWSVVVDAELPGRARVWHVDKTIPSMSDAATPALALTAACLKARAAIEAAGDVGEGEL